MFLNAASKLNEKPRSERVAAVIGTTSRNQRQRFRKPRPVSTVALGRPVDPEV